MGDIDEAVTEALARWLAAEQARREARAYVLGALRPLRQPAVLTQRTERAGITPGAVANAERGITVLSAETAARVCAALGITEVTSGAA